MIVVYFICCVFCIWTYTDKNCEYYRGLSQCQCRDQVTQVNRLQVQAWGFILSMLELQQFLELQKPISPDCCNPILKNQVQPLFQFLTCTTDSSHPSLKGQYRHDQQDTVESKCLFFINSVTENNTHMIRSYYRCYCISEPVFSHCVHLNLGHRYCPFNVCI